MLAAIIGATAADIAIVPAVSTAAGIVAANLPPPGSGENIVVAENEFGTDRPSSTRRAGLESRPDAARKLPWPGHGPVADGV